MNIKKHLGFIINLCAIALFIPGIYLPIFSLNMAATAQISGASLSTPIIDKELSILGTCEELWHNDRILVAVLILLFSVCIPVLKTSLVTVAYFIKNQLKAAKIISFINLIGKWSMADVFVIAIFLAVMSTNHADTESLEKFTFFGFKMDLLMSSQTLSAVGNGFYFFTAYCILSLIGTQLSQSAFKKHHKQA